FPFCAGSDFCACRSVSTRARSTCLPKKSAKTRAPASSPEATGPSRWRTGMYSERMAILIFAGCAAFVVYVLVGYPLLLDFLARHSARPVKKRDIEPSVTVVLPVYNGARWIAAKLDSILALDYPSDLLDVLVVSDGSDDGTAEIVRRYPD